ncbi:MAG TPA: exodeoxyribonuclease VII large subunit [Tepidisphaeraceae bacterium]|jgi:exodeoxyribonuclease VII large subunit|nr:exodeoxyribonuclease VII large subunit [Tepidisphaeraceae bacterium]
MPDNFFEFHERLAKQRAAARSPKPPAGDVDALTVSQLTAAIEKAIKTGVPGTVTVRGEASNVSNRQASGHLYFTLKDSAACINCVMWKDSASRLQFKLEDGLEMIATGRVSVYAPQGRYQLQVQHLQPAGRGALELAFRQLQAKLAAEGLFAAERKKPIPPYPMHIALLTSRATAALQDMLKVLRRFPWLKLMLYHAPVQGDGSAARIAQAIAHLNRRSVDVGGVDVILLSRGGGSLEDLWSFNEEIVARAIAASRIPIVTGIGHEVDCTISDLVADYHAHTPTEAAQVITGHWNRAGDDVRQMRMRLERAAGQMVQDARQRLAGIERHEFLRRPLDRLQMLRQLLDERQKSATLALTAKLVQARHRLMALEPRLSVAAQSWLKFRSARLDAFDRQLQALSPQAVLNRGYTITTLKKTGQILRSSAAVISGDRVTTRFADGETESIVQDSRQMSLFE